MWKFAGDVVGGLWAATVSGSFSWSLSFLWDDVVGLVRGVRKRRPSTDTIVGVSDGGLDGTIGILSSRCNATEAQMFTKSSRFTWFLPRPFSTIAFTPFTPFHHARFHGITKAQSMRG
jgi:hypothetical protein